MDQQFKTPSQTYWASLPIDELLPEIEKKVEEYYKFLQSAGLLNKYRKSYNAYYGYSNSGYFASSSEVAQGGEEGELSLVKINEYRNLIQHLLVMTTSSRPSLECKAANTDKRSKTQTILGNGIIDYYMRDKRLERFLKYATETSLYLGEGYVHMQWDTSLGAQYGVDPTTQQVKTEGDVKYSNLLGPLEVVRDVKSHSYQASPWKIAIVRENKFDLAARYPEKAEDILAITDSIDQETRSQNYLSSMYASTTDFISVRYMYHEVTPAVPNGRAVISLSSDVYLIDGPMPYTDLPQGIPLYRIVPSEWMGTPFGYTHAWDILGLGEVTDALFSAITTNQTTFAVQNVLVPKGHDISYQQLTGGLNLIEYDPKLGKPEALNLTKTTPEVFSFLDKVEKTKTLMMGVNDVIKGDPQASLKSGSALALVATQAIQFNSGLQASYAALLEDVGTATIRMLQTFANTRRVASIAGKSNRFMIKEFAKEDIQQINRVVVDISNPLTQTVQGRLEMAKDLLQIPGLIRHPDQYIQVVTTGRYEPLIQGEEAELLTIDGENEWMQDGKKPIAVLTDNHALHVREHKSVLAMPDARLDPNVVRAVLSHIQEHINLATTSDPRVLVLTDQQPLPPPPPPPGSQPPQGPQNGPPQPSGPQGPPTSHMMAGPMNHPPQHPQGGPGPGAKNLPAMHNTAPDAQQKANTIKQPLMPTNPMTGNRFNPNPIPQG